MASDEERREVAAKLRERTKRKLGKSMQLMFSETLGLYRTNICWVRENKATETWDAIVNYLANLIDRPVAVSTRTKDGFTVCNACGFNFIVQAPALYRCEEECGADYCPKCGAPLEMRYEDD